MKNSQREINEMLDVIIKAAFTSTSEISDKHRDMMREFAKELQDYKRNMERLNEFGRLITRNERLVAFYREQAENLWVNNVDHQQCDECGRII